MIRDRVTINNRSIFDMVRRPVLARESAQATVEPKTAVQTPLDPLAQQIIAMGKDIKPVTFLLSVKAAYEFLKHKADTGK